MNHPIKVVDIELGNPLVDIERLENYQSVKAFVRLHGTPLGTLDLPLNNGRLTANTVGKAVINQLSWPLVEQMLRNRLNAPLKDDGSLVDELFTESSAPKLENLPLVTVAVCTRDRPDELADCLGALQNLEYPNLDLIVVDNASSTNSTEKIVEELYPDIRYFYEPRPGLDWARNRAILEAKGEIIAYADDDVIVDQNWVKAIVTVFNESPEVMCVTGYVSPYELETNAQQLFEEYGGFGRGFERRWIKVDPNEAWKYYGTGSYGTGANMAFRRSLFQEIGSFDPALDVGTVTNGGGDIEMFFRVLMEGHTLVYEPNAIVHHKHRRDYHRLKDQIRNNGIGLYSYFVRSIQAYPKEKGSLVKLAVWWFWWWSIRRWVLSYVRPSGIPRNLITAELKGSLIGLFRYQKAKKQAEEIERLYGRLPEIERRRAKTKKATVLQPEDATAVHFLDLTRPIAPLEDAELYFKTRLYVSCGRYSLGFVEITNNYQPIRISRLKKIVTKNFGLRLLDLEQTKNVDEQWYKLLEKLRTHFLADHETSETQAFIGLDTGIKVSIVIATLDRPEELRVCLKHVLALETARNVEIIVVDNNPDSALTPPVIKEFPNVVLVNEPRKGLAYARNAGFTASTGDIVIATDDDVIVPPMWLEQLIAPFADPKVMVTTGNVLPYQLSNTAQKSFEIYGGLGKGFQKFTVDRTWFDSFRWHAVPTWELGATANAAFRASIFTNRKIGLMEESLGPGMPSGVGEDTYLFYKVIKAGFSLVYEPNAYVWHKHRNTMQALRKQLFNYSKGHVAYNLTTALNDRDFRGLLQVFIHLPIWRLRQLIRHSKEILKGDTFRNKGHYPLSLTLIEIYGNAISLWTFWRSKRRVNREGRSKPYIPAFRRTSLTNQTYVTSGFRFAKTKE